MSLSVASQVEVLGVRFPHVLNRLVQVWQHTSETEEYLNGLMVDTRGNRQGFPLQALNEIAALRDHHRQRLAPQPQDVWSDLDFTR